MLISQTSSLKILSGGNQDDPIGKVKKDIFILNYEFIKVQCGEYTFFTQDFCV